MSEEQKLLNEIRKDVKTLLGEFGGMKAQLRIHWSLILLLLAGLVGLGWTAFRG